VALTTNLANWLAGGTRERELRDTQAAWNETEALWRASPLGKEPTYRLAIQFMQEAFEAAERVPPTPISVAFSGAIDDLLQAEDVGELEPDWTVVSGDVAVASEMRSMLVRRRRWAGDFQRMQRAFRERALIAWRVFLEALPQSCYELWDDSANSFEVPLIELLDDPADLIDSLVLFPYSDDTLRYDLFLKYRQILVRNMLVASGLPPDANPHAHSHRIVRPPDQRGKSARDLAELYLAETPFASLFELPVPFHLPQAVRFEHAHIVGGTGHGKTQLMQRMIHADLVAAQTECRSVVVIDSQGDLINKLVRLSVFSPDEPRSLADRLVLIDPADVEFPAALNLFDVHLDRLRNYRPVDRERVLNGVVELYEVFFGALLGAELTQKQGVIFRYLARLMLTIPGATIHTLMQLMEDGRPFRAHMQALDGSARYFFETEFFHPSFAATKRQILKRLWGVLSTPAFERMFAQKANKLDLFEALNDGKIVLINTAKDLLKEEGSQLFGRFFVALLAQVALERSTIPEDERTPTFVYVDEAQEYFDERIETILNQARKYRVGLTLAHQTLDQLSPRLRAAIHANTSLKCAGGVSARDSRALADELHTTSDFIESMRRRGNRTEFALWLKQQTPHAIRLSVPLGFLEGQPILPEDEFEELLRRNRDRYCGTLDDVIAPVFRSAESAVDDITDEAPVTGRPRQTERPIDREEPKSGPADAAMARRPREPSELGKGGSQHRYVQHLIKQLAEERGLRAVIEEPVDGGQVDVGLHQGDLSIACEISVTSTPEYEARNLAKCLRAGFVRVWAIAPDAKRRRAIQQQAELRLGAEEAARIEFLTTEELIETLDALAVPEPEEQVVKGYRVKTTKRAVAPAEARERRAAVARILSQSMRGSDR
jgi:Type IV secretion-system coupling protein DNA-binding domain